MEILEALKQVEGSGASYVAIRQWEGDLMVQMRMRPEEYCDLDIEERSFLVCSHYLPSWTAMLEGERSRREYEAKYGKGDV
jgi:hypothetical protein